jgi:hypothetical protein
MYVINLYLTDDTSLQMPSSCSQQSKTASATGVADHDPATANCGEIWDAMCTGV